MMSVFLQLAVALGDGLKRAREAVHLFPRPKPRPHGLAHLHRRRVVERYAYCTIRCKDLFVILLDCHAFATSSISTPVAVSAAASSRLVAKSSNVSQFPRWYAAWSGPRTYGA